MRNQCAVEQDLSRYLEREHMQSVFDEKVEELAAEMMLPNGACDPFDGRNLSEAFSEAGDRQFSQLAKALQSGDDLDAAKQLRAITTDYWRKYSDTQATAELEKMISECGD